MNEQFRLPAGCAIPEGYRRLEIGEWKQKGDMFWVDNQWTECSIWDVQVGKFCVIIRPINAKIRQRIIIGDEPVAIAQRVKDYLNKIKNKL
jgi:hypothetical protein